MYPIYFALRCIAKSALQWRPAQSDAILSDVLAGQEISPMFRNVEFKCSSFVCCYGELIASS